jgi:hypothetical protein
MRQERGPIEDDGQSDGYTFFFQIANDGRRQACCVKVDAPDIHEASVLFRRNWTVIEAMARDGIRTGEEDSMITVVMP